MARLGQSQLGTPATHRSTWRAFGPSGRGPEAAPRSEAEHPRRPLIALDPASSSVNNTGSEGTTCGVARPATEAAKDLSAWLERKGFASAAQVKGSMSQQRVADPTAFERANYMKVLQSWR